MKKTLLSICLAFSAFMLQAQFSISPNPLVANGSINNDEFKASGYIVNNYGEEIQLTWERIMGEVPAGWSTYVCFADDCYVPSVGTAPSLKTVPAGGEVYISVAFRADGNAGAQPGSFDVTIKVSDANNASRTLDVVFQATASAAASTYGTLAERITVYPNPVTEFFMLSDNSSVEHIAVYNLVGKRVKQFNNVVSGQRYYVSELPRGMYLVSFLDRNSSVISTQRLSKR